MTIREESIYQTRYRINEWRNPNVSLWVAGELVSEFSLPIYSGDAPMIESCAIRAAGHPWVLVSADGAVVAASLRSFNPIETLTAEWVCERMYPVFFSAQPANERELMIRAAQGYLDAIRKALAAEAPQAATSSPEQSSADSAEKGGAL